jgi:periplasmic divalent cation tolerance protein
MLIVFTTTATSQEAEALARGIVEERLAGCVQILPQITSVYEWKGSVNTEPEFLLLIKTLPERWDELRAYISEHHSYSVPEIVAVESAAVSEPYLAWLSAIVQERTPD